MSPSTRALTPHPDRLLPPDPALRSVARTIYEAVRDLPVISPHGHVSPHLLLDDEQFPDPTSLLITPDHYVTRMLHASGVPLEELGVGQGAIDEAAARVGWRHLCSHWQVFAGTPVRYWLEQELAEIFDVTVQPSAKTADEIYDQIVARLGQPQFRPRALFERFGIEVLATTDDPVDSLAAHAKLAADESFRGRVVPTFRPDRHLEVAAPGWRAAVDALADASGCATDTYAGWVAAMENRRAYFAAHGAVSTDHSHIDLGSDVLDDGDAERIYAAARAGTVEAEQALALRRHMFTEQARMATEDGLTMTVHPGSRRNHDLPTFERFGADQGHDIPVRVDYTDPLRPLLSRYGNHPNLTLVLFTLDETSFSRELAPLAGYYPSVYVGQPWWFLDAPDAIRRWRSSITDTVGFSRTSGFIDDTRAFCSIPARHDMSRRLDAGHLAGLVADHRLEVDEATEIAIDTVAGLPRRVFGL